MRRIGGIEAGGTKMALAVGDGTGDVFERTQIPTTDPAQCVPHMVEWFRSRDIDALGIGAFGPTCVSPSDPRYGQILETPKSAWKYHDFRGDFMRGLGIPVGYDTDVNAACLGEATFGAARGCDCVVYVTVGTGIGAGVMIEGTLLHGMLHPEAGHIVVPKVEGDRGRSVCPYHDSCLEGMASGPSIERRWGKKAADLASDDRVWDLEAAYLAEGVSTYVLCYAPQRIVLGGGVMSQGQLFPLVRDKVQEILHGYIATSQVENISEYIVPAGCGGAQGILGAIELGRRALCAEQLDTKAV